VHGNIITSKGRRRPIDNHCNSRPKRLQPAHYFYFLCPGCCTHTAIIIWRILYLALRTLLVLVHIVQRARRKIQKRYIYIERIEFDIVPPTSSYNTPRTVCAGGNRRKTFNRKKPPCAPHCRSHAQWYIISGDGGLYNPKTFVAAATVIL